MPEAETATCVCVIGDQCEARHPDGYVCTRNPNHPGEHVACAHENAHEIATWDREGADD